MGDRDSIYGFAALGLDTFPVTDPVEAAKQLRRLAEGDYAVVYVTEALAAQLETEIDRYRAQRLPAIIPIPGNGHQQTPAGGGCMWCGTPLWARSTCS